MNFYLALVIQIYIWIRNVCQVLFAFHCCHYKWFHYKNEKPHNCENERNFFFMSSRCTQQFPASATKMMLDDDDEKFVCVFFVVSTIIHLSFKPKISTPPLPSPFPSTHHIEQLSGFRFFLKNRNSQLLMYSVYSVCSAIIMVWRYKHFNPLPIIHVCRISWDSLYSHSLPLSYLPFCM